MDSNKLQLYMAAHNELVRAAELPESTRPYSVTNRLEELEKLIMEELNKTEPAPTPTDDDTPF